MSERLSPEVIRAGELVLDKSRRVVWRGGYAEIHLTKRECRLLEVFMTHSGEVLNHEILMRQVWDTDYVGDIRVLYAYIHWLRRKIEGAAGGAIYTVRGMGYRFSAAE